MSLRKCFLYIIITIVAASAVAQAAPALIRSGDTLAVAVKDEQDLSRFYVVDDEGKIALGEMGSVSLAGKTAEQAQDAIREVLGRFIKQPDVQVTIAKPRTTKITITGDVKTPGTVEAVQEVGIRDVLSFAGGALPTADLSQVTLVRSGQLIKVNLNEVMASADPSKDIKLEDGDMVNVPSRVVGEFTFLGGVTSVGTYPLLRGTKVLDALKLAGGIAEGQRVETIRIVREGQDETTVDLTALVGGKVEENRVIQPGDTLVASSDQVGPASYSILGGVNRPGRFDLKQKITWPEAVASAGGFVQGARPDEATLVRRQADGTFKSTPVDFGQFLKEGAPPQYVQDGDVLTIRVKGSKRPLLDYLPYLTPFLFL